MNDVKRDRDPQGGAQHVHPLSRAPQEGFVMFTPKLVLNGSQAIRGNVEKPVIAPDKFVRFNGGGQPIAAGAESTPLRFRWPYDCIVVQWKLVNVNDETGTPSIGMTCVKAKLQLGGPNNEQLITDDAAESFQSLQQLTPYEDEPQPIYRIARNGVIWTLTFRNDHSQRAFSPDVTLGVRLIELDGCEPVSPEIVR